MVTRTDGLSLEDAAEHVAARAFRDGPVGRVGLELELHLVDLDAPLRRPSWELTTDLVRGLPRTPAGSRITLEPGGQVELSGPPAAGVLAAVTDLRADLGVVRRALAARGFGLAALGTDPARPVHRVNPQPRYAAMERHFDALGCAGAGRQMMTATAALQVNLDAGAPEQWRERMCLVRSLVPALVALSSTSPYLAGQSSGWHSMRQGVWRGIDHARSDPCPEGEPGRAWAGYALDAPVMLLRDPDADDGGCRPVTLRVTFADWARGAAPFGRPPTVADVDYHLTTLFPPVRPRGYVEIRCLDALPDRWWPAVAATVATLVDEPAAAAAVAEVVTGTTDCWTSAARDGVADPAVRAAVTGCLDVAAAYAPPALAEEIRDLAAVFAAGHSLASLLRERIDRIGPLAVLEEEARA